MSGTLFDRFTNVWNRKQEARVAELEADKAQLIADGEFRDNRIKDLEVQLEGVQSEVSNVRAISDDRGVRITELEAELAPFREYIAANAEAETGDGEEGGGEEGAEAEEVEGEQPRDERGRFTAAEPEAAE